MEIEGTIVNRNNRAKEQVLYKVIAEKNAEIVRWKSTCEEIEEINQLYIDKINELKVELRTLKSKEYRRAVRRKKQKVGEISE